MYQQTIYPPKMTQAQKDRVIRGYIGEERWAALQEPLPSDADKDLQARVPFGKHQGMTLGALMESNPSYLVWLASDKCTLIEGRFAAAVHAVAERYKHRIADRIRRSR